MLSRTSLLRGTAAVATALLTGGVAFAGDPCGDPAAGACNEPNGTPGCADAICCGDVCAADSFCCDVEWDSTCVDLALTLCGGSAGCGDPNSGACDAPNGTPGCEDAQCCSNVCAEDPYCCDVAWDSICASESAILCYGGDPPANDLCEDAIDLGTGDSVTAFSSLGAQTDGIELPLECESFGETVIRGDIWYTWTASISEIVVISTCNDADFDTRLALWEGTCADKILVGCNDDGLGCAGFTSELIAPVTAGTTYFIQLGGFNPPAQGTGNLTICEGDACLAGCVASCEKSDVVELEICGGDINGGCNDPAGATQPISIGDTVCGTMWAAGGTRDTDFFSFTLAEASTVSMTLDSNAPGVILLVTADCAIAGGGAAECGVPVEACAPAGDYTIFVGADGFDGLPCDSGPLNLYRLSVTAEPVGVIPGDTCAEAIDLGTFEGDVEVDTFCTGTDGADPPTICDSFGSVTIYNDLFYRWTVPTDGDWSVSTCNQATFDTRLAAFDACGGALVACNDDGDGCAGFSSLMSLPGLTAGTELIIQLGSWDGTQGTATMTISEGDGQPEPPANDECEGAIAVTDGALFWDNLGSSPSGQFLPTECADFGNDQINNDLWYVYDAVCDGSVTLSFCGGSTVDTKIAVYDAAEGCPVGGSVPVACNDDSCGLQSEASFIAVCGESYYFRLGTYSAAVFGTGTLNITCDGTECGGGGGCQADFNDDNVVNGADYGYILSAWGPCSGCPEDLDGDGQVGGSDVGALLSQWGECP